MFTGTTIVEFLRANPALAVFLTLAVGFTIGKLHYKSFSLGTVTSVLLVGVLVGQMNIPIPEPARTIFFLMFLFAVGYSVGPQFFRGLKKDGIPQVGFAVMQCVVSLLAVWGCARLMGYSVSQAAGLLSGSQTMSAALGVATDTINQLSGKATLDSSAMAVCYAVTYIFGTAGSAWILGSLGPRLLGGVGKVSAAAKELEAQMGSDMSITAGLDPAMQDVEFRAFSADNDWFDGNGKTIADFEKHLGSMGKRVFVERLRQNGVIKDLQPGRKINRGDHIVISGRREYVIGDEDWIGSEIEDSDLTNFNVESLEVVVNRKGAASKEIADILSKTYMHGVSVKSIRRAGVGVPVLGKTKLDTGDRITLVGLKQDVDRAAANIGFGDPQMTQTTVSLVGAGIFIGGLVMGWVLVAKLGAVPLSLTVSGGTLIAGLVCGWLRARKPSLGGIPEPSVWLMNNLGLNVFIAIVGITTGPTFVEGFREVGWTLFLVGIVATSIPLLAGIFFGRHLFKFNDALTLGCAAGARTTTAALNSIEETIGSNVSSLGYTVTYAVGNTMLILWGVVLVLMMV